VEDGLRRLQDKEAEVPEQKTKNLLLQCQLDAFKLERTREVWLLKKEIENLEKNNETLAERKKSLAKTHHGKSFLTALPSLLCLSYIL
jgi:hypothetical protein